MSESTDSRDKSSIKPIPNTEVRTETHDQEYGDLTALNRDGIILKSIGRRRLEGFANDYLELLGTSSAIYEANGDYAFGIFTSGWCRMMDLASRNLCDTSDNAEALSSGRWLCHESCWADCAKRVIAESAPVDIACNGGLRMYGVPIMAHGDVVGAMNFGYGDPPTDPEQLRKLAKAYHLDYDDLVREADAYDSRPPFIIELAKKRLHATARLIGSVIETKKAEEALLESRQLLKKTQQIAKTGGWVWDEEFKSMTWTDETYRIHGMEPGDLSSGSPEHIQRSLACYDKKDRLKIESAFRRCVEKGTPYTYEFPITTMQGQRKWIQTSAKALLKGGVVAKVYGYIIDITERKKAEEELTHSHRLMKYIIEHTRSAVAVHDRDLKYIYVSQRYLDDYKVKDENIIGKHHYDVFPDLPHKWREVHQKALAGEVISAEDDPYEREDGSVEWTRWECRPWYESDGSIGGIIVYTEVITERKQREQLLTEQKELLEAIYRNAPLVMMVVNGERRIQQVNGFATQFADRDAEEMLGLRGGEALRCMHALDDPRGCGFGDFCRQCVIRNTVLDTLQTARTHFQIEAPYYFKGKENETQKLHFFLSTTPIEVQGERMVLVTLQDITRLKGMEEDLRKDREHMDHILRATRTNMNTLDSEFNLLQVDEVWQKIYGEPQGRKCHEYFMGLNKPCAGCGVPQALATREIVVTEEYLPKEDRFIEVHTVPFQNEKGEWLVTEFNIDITERKLAEAEKEKLQSQLLRVQKMESVGRLAGGVAHDFNNMLGVILGNVEMALEQLEPGQQVFDDLQEIRKAAERSVELTRQLLAFARKQTIAPRIIDLNETVEGMLTMLRRLIGENIHLAWMPGEKHMAVKMDPSQIDQILANLCVNARDAIDGVGKLTIETGLVHFDEEYCKHHVGFIPGEFVVLVVSDDGCGMGEETINNLFEPFFTTKDVGKGTGLGLASVYGAVKQNKGFINVYSEPGQGTTFKIYLPRYQAGMTIKDDKATSKPTSTAGGSETILLVEDEPAILHTTRMMLQRMGYVVIAAITPGEAIRLACEHSSTIDLLMTDVVMPEMNGRDLAKNLLSIYPDIKRLFMSGYTANVIAHHGVLCAFGKRA